jgi:DNA polymerase III epsilon subunit-like protein
MKVAVVDIETNGLNPDFDSIFQVGIVLLDTETGETSDLLDITCKESDKMISETAWIFLNSPLKYTDVLHTKEFREYKNDIQKIFDLYVATAYNQKFDFGFLEKRGIVIKRKFKDPMHLSTDVCKLPSKRQYYSNSYKYPSVQEAWNKFFPRKPMKESHLAIEDARMEATILYKLRDFYPQLFTSKV